MFECPAASGRSHATLIDPGDVYHGARAPYLAGVFRVPVTPDNQSFRLRSDEGDDCARVNWETHACETTACAPRATALLGTIVVSDGRRPAVPVQVIGCEDEDFLEEDGAFVLPQVAAGRCVLSVVACGEVLLEMEVRVPASGELDLGELILPSAPSECPAPAPPSVEEQVADCEDARLRGEVRRTSSAVLAAGGVGGSAVFAQLEADLAAIQTTAYEACLERATADSERR